MTEPRPRRATALRLHRRLLPVWSPEGGLRGWLSTNNNNDIGLLFLGVATAFFVIGGILAMLIRAQLASPRSAFMAPEVYNQIFTMHGTVMMFLFAIPFFEALSILMLPGMLGTRDLAFPRLGAYGLWVYIFGGLAVIVAMLLGLSPDGGWFMYPPLSSAAFSPGIGADVWLLGITSIEVSAIAAACEVVVTVLRYRAAGMSLARMPIFAWVMLVVAVMILTAFPPMILGSVLLELERALDCRQRFVGIHQQIAPTDINFIFQHQRYRFTGARFLQVTVEGDDAGDSRFHAGWQHLDALTHLHGA